MPPLQRTLGTLPSGRVIELSMSMMTQFLRDNYRSQEDEARRDEARMRLAFYKDKARRFFEDDVDVLFKNSKNRMLRKELIPFSEFQNVTKRIIREISTVYAEPADRKIRQANERFKKFMRNVVKQDRRMRQVNRFGNLLNNVLVWPDVDPARRRPILRIITPDKFTAVAHPNDPTLPVAFILDQKTAGVQVTPLDPHYLVMTEHEFFKLDDAWRFVEGTYREHGLGRMPALLYSREEPEDRILDWTSGRDLISAHRAVTMMNVMLFKHQKSGVKMPYAAGDTSTTATGQPMDEESLLQIGEGVTLNTLDLGADPASYIDSVRAIIKQIAANYGIPESVFDLSYQASSGFEIELKRSGLREIRRDQILDFRPFEADLADLWSEVLRQSGSEWAFNSNGFQIDFGEIDTPQEPIARLDYWEKLEQLGLTNRVEMYLHMNPEATEDQAMRAVEQNLRMRVQRMQAFQSENSGVFGPNDSGRQPAPQGEGNESQAIEEIVNAVV